MASKQNKTGSQDSDEEPQIANEDPFAPANISFELKNLVAS